MELKACPNPDCDKMHTMRITISSKGWLKATCQQCGRSTGWMKCTEAEAIIAWNTRSDLKPLHDLADEWRKMATLDRYVIASQQTLRCCAETLESHLKQMEGK